jgi:hypothetical protein
MLLRAGCPCSSSPGARRGRVGLMCAATVVGAPCRRAGAGRRLHARSGVDMRVVY